MNEFLEIVGAIALGLTVCWLASELHNSLSVGALQRRFWTNLNQRRVSTEWEQFMRALLEDKGEGK